MATYAKCVKAEQGRLWDGKNVKTLKQRYIRMLSSSVNPSKRLGRYTLCRTCRFSVQQRLARF